MITVEENLFLLFSYQADIDIFDSFENIQNSLRLDFEFFLDEITQSENCRHKDALDFYGYIRPYLCAQNVWLPSSKDEDAKFTSIFNRRVFRAKPRDIEDKWLKWTTDLAISELNPSTSPPTSPMSSTCSTCYGVREVYEWPWIDPPTKIIQFGAHIPDWMLKATRLPIPVLSPLGLHRLLPKIKVS